MGNFWSSFISYMFIGPQKIVMIGLDAAGKTTLLYYIKQGNGMHTIPTIGFNVETVQIGNFECIVWDIAGQSKLRSLWSHYLQNTNLLIFVVDSHDQERLPEAAAELERMMKEPELAECPVLILGNKQDLPNAASPAELVDRMFPNGHPERPWHVQGCCAQTGDGVDAGLRWATERLESIQSSWFSLDIEMSDEIDRL